MLDCYKKYEACTSTAVLHLFMALMYNEREYHFIVALTNVLLAGH